MDGDHIKTELRIIWMTWGAMFISLYFYIRVCHMLDLGWEPILDKNFQSNILKVVLYIVSVLLFILSIYCRKYILKSKNDNYIKRASRMQLKPAIVKYATAVIFSNAVAMLIGIAGIGMFLLTKDFQTLYIFVAISAIALVYHRPKTSEFENVASSMNNIKPESHESN